MGKVVNLFKKVQKLVSEKSLRLVHGIYIQGKGTRRRPFQACAVGSLAIAAKCIQKTNEHYEEDFNGLMKKYPILKKVVTHPESPRYKDSAFRIIESLYENYDYDIPAIQKWLKRRVEKPKKKVAV